MYIGKNVDMIKFDPVYRFIDVAQGQKLHIWRGEANESSFPSLISAICSTGADKMQAGGASTFPSFIATGLSSGHCKLFDARSGNVIASWRAHDGYVTKVCSQVTILRNTKFGFAQGFTDLLVNYSWQHLRTICSFPALLIELYEFGI